MYLKIKLMTYSVQLYDQTTDKKLEIIHINNTINLDDNDTLHNFLKTCS